ncbi:integron protein cassette protein [Rodentibacter sp. Ppn85]|uniref:integron protein cassette protein n=1 Tax=Rodentibacter sp. Ppn85 TaxID=1908525 RepID=UPI00098588B4|nr:integron protein cassette protein [Rodentibacter sp. Ppn85]OOF67018.1 integron protein cassette protein [Rodentibacter sp. Ppn85]
MKKFISILLLTVVLILTGCSATVNRTSSENSYQSQNYTKINSSILLGEFTYEPAKIGKVRESQPENTAVDTIYFDRSIAEIVKHFTAKELMLTDVKIGTGHLTLLGNVKELKIDDLGYSVDFSYTINYKILKNGSTAWDRDYSPTKVTVSKFDSNPMNTITNQVYRMIAAGYEKFINDNGVKTLLETNK